MSIPVTDPLLVPIAEKVAVGGRLSAEDGLTLYRSRDLLGVGRMADAVRRRINGRRAYFVTNQHLNYTNVCSNRCEFCAYARDRGEDRAFTLGLDEVRQRLLTTAEQPIRELHVVGGLNDELGFDYYLDMLAIIREVHPQATIKAFTAVEIDHLARLTGLGLGEVLDRLKAAGLAMLPGGGAEVISDRVHKRLFPCKIDGRRWLEVAAAAHQRGLTSNATMLYGHIETLEERVGHLQKLRELQDRTGGFSAFIPLAFHSENTRLSHLPPTTGVDDLKNVAVARLMLDNIPHIKAYWVMIGEKLAQVALSFGADDLDGTIVEEKITHMAGAKSAKGLTRSRMVRLITAAGFEPVERDSFYRPVSAAAAQPQGQGAIAAGRSGDVSRLLDAASAGERLSENDAALLWEHAELPALADTADRIRRRRHPDPVVTFVIDRNINYTNVCRSGCRFCAFYRSPGDPDAYVIDRETLKAKVEETLALGGTQVLLQGGLHPDLPLDFYQRMLADIKACGPVHIHGFSPPEIAHLAEHSGMGLRELIALLKDAGLDSIPGGGAEILVDRVRRQVSPHKCDADTWLEVMRCAHDLGMRSSATMMFGHLEGPADIVAHLMRVRDLQDETGGFTAFIPWPFQPGHTDLAVATATAAEYLRVLALARIVLDNVDNLQASWVTQGDKIAQTALFFGANDLGSTMIEENVVAAAGIRFRLPMTEMVRLIHDGGFEAVQRDCYYRTVKVWPATPVASGEAN